MRADDAELFSLFGTHLSVYSSQDFLVRSFHSPRSETRNIRNFLSWMFKKPHRNCRSGLSKYVREHIIQLNIGDGKAVLCSIFLAGSEVGELPTIAHQIPKLANICRRDKAPGNKVVLENVSDPFCVSLVGFLSTNRFYVFGVGKDDVAGGLQNVVSGNLIFACGFHTHIFAVVFC